jgi:hypothetical protein
MSEPCLIYCPHCRLLGLPCEALRGPLTGQVRRVEGLVPVLVREELAGGLYLCRDLSNGEEIRLPGVLLMSEEE